MLRRTIDLATIVLFASALECYDMQIRNVRGDTPEIDVDDELTRKIHEALAGADQAVGIV